MRRTSRKGSALVGVIWLLAVLSILIASYAVDAHLQTRINLYLRERVAVDHLTDAGLAIAEVILTEYQNVTEAGDESTYEKQLEEDRWYAEKLMLKAQGGKEVTTGAVPVDALNPDGGTVTVTIRPIESKFNINNLYEGGDKNFGEIWMRILAVSGIPGEYWNSIVNGWSDWRDTDGNATETTRTKSSGSGTRDSGAESDFYAEAYEEYQRDVKYNEEEKNTHKNRNYRPKARDGEIADIEELKAIKGFNEYDEKPINADAILNGGVLNPSDKEDEWITITNGISSYFSLYGSGKINVNAVKDPRILAVIPGIYRIEDDPEDVRPEDIEAAMEIAKNIIQLRDAPPKDGENPLISSSDDDERDSGAYKDFNDLQQRLDRAGLDVQKEASEYFTFQPDKFFEITIVGRSSGIVHKIVALALVQDGKVRYLRWQEDP